ncbi:MAG: hypothetical protein K2N30_02575 [Clostridia bacterium]|nr:hypothetical protein [Clostridia bacterium]
MIFFVGNDGTIINSFPSPVYQGAADTNNIYLVAPFAKNTQVTVAFKLPNGVLTTRYPMTQVNDIPGIVNKQSGEGYSGWSFSMPNEITQYSGTVTVQFFFYAAQKCVITATSSTSFTVGRGVPELLPDTPSADVYSLLLNNISALQEQVNDGTFSARSIMAWRNGFIYGLNEIVFYPENGEYGTFVKSLIDENSNAPYTEGVLNSAYWEEITDFNVLNELYSLKADLQAAIETSQSNANAAAESASQAAASLQGAQQSAENAEASAQRVESAAEYLESVQDGTTAVPKATADETGANIANQFSIVNSDIAGLREDITNEAHFRGLFDSVEALESAYPTATPNDYAYIVGGNIWIYNTDGGWTDSGEPSPNTAVPASDSTPLMDGVASAGTSSQYARGDHRHPTDTTRASEVDLASETTRAKAEEAKKANLDGAAFTGDISATTVTGTNGVYDGEARVYSTNNPPHVLSRTTQYKIFSGFTPNGDDNLGFEFSDSDIDDYWQISITGAVTATHYFYSDNPNNPISTDIHITARISSLDTNVSDRVYAFISEGKILRGMNWNSLNFDWRNTRVKVFADNGYLTPNFYGPAGGEYAGYTGFHLNNETQRFQGNVYGTLIIGRVYNTNGAFGAWGTESPIYNSNNNRVFDIDIFGATVKRR